MSDLFTNIAENHVPDEPTFEDLPPNKWCGGVICSDANGKAAPNVDVITFMDKETGEERKMYKFRAGMICRGGEKGVDESRHNNRFCFFDPFILPGKNREGEQIPGLVGGRFAGFLNNVFSPGVGDDLLNGQKGEALKAAKEERSAKRWSNTISILKAVAEEKGISLENYDGHTDLNEDHRTGLMLAGIASMAMCDQQYPIMFKTNRRTWKKDGEENSRLEVGAVDALTTESLATRKVTMFEEIEGVEAPTSTKF